MGWGSGSSLFTWVWSVVREEVPAERRVLVAKRLMRAFENSDCDTLEDCLCSKWPELESAYEELHLNRD